MSRELKFVLVMLERGNVLAEVAVNTDREVVSRFAQPDVFRDTMDSMRRILEKRQERSEIVREITRSLGKAIIDKIDKLDGFDINEAMNTMEEIMSRGQQWSNMPPSMRIATELDRLIKEDDKNELR